MKPIEFAEQNVTYAKDQPPYLPLPAHKTEDGQVITVWKFSLKERIKVFFGANLYWSQKTFNQPLQPVYASIGTIFEKK